MWLNQSKIREGDYKQMDSNDRRKCDGESPFIAADGSNVVLHRPGIVGVNLDLCVFEVWWIVDHVEHKAGMEIVVSNVVGLIVGTTCMTVNMNHCRKT